MGFEDDTLLPEIVRRSRNATVQGGHDGFDLVAEDVMCYLHHLDSGLCKEPMELLKIYNHLMHPYKLWFEHGVTQVGMILDRGVPLIKLEEAKRRKLIKANAVKRGLSSSTKKETTPTKDGMSDSKEPKQRALPPYPDDHVFDSRGALWQLGRRRQDGTIVAMKKISDTVILSRVMDNRKLRTQMIEIFFCKFLKLDVVNIKSGCTLWVDFSLNRSISPVKATHGVYVCGDHPETKPFQNDWLEADWNIPFWLARLKYKLALVVATDGDLLGTLSCGIHQMKETNRVREQKGLLSAPIPQIFLFNKMDLGEPDPEPKMDKKGEDKPSNRRVVWINRFYDIICGLDTPDPKKGEGSSKGWSWPFLFFPILLYTRGNDYVSNADVTPKLGARTLWPLLDRLASDPTLQTSKQLADIIKSPSGFLNFVKALFGRKGLPVGHADSVERARKKLEPGLLGAWMSCALLSGPSEEYREMLSEVPAAAAA